MKKTFIIIGTILLSLVITFVIFETLSWYHFGDVPTKVVFIRLIAFFCVIEGLAITIFIAVNKKKKKN